jgi:hypothetical protein
MRCLPRCWAACCSSSCWKRPSSTGTATTTRATGTTTTTTASTPSRPAVAAGACWWATASTTSATASSSPPPSWPTRSWAGHRAGHRRARDPAGGGRLHRAAQRRLRAARRCSTTPCRGWRRWPAACWATSWSGPGGAVALPAGGGGQQLHLRGRGRPDAAAAAPPVWRETAVAAGLDGSRAWAWWWLARLLARARPLRRAFSAPPAPAGAVRQHLLRLAAQQQRPTRRGGRARPSRPGRSPGSWRGRGWPPRGAGASTVWPVQATPAAVAASATAFTGAAMRSWAS